MRGEGAGRKQNIPHVKSQPGQNSAEGCGQETRNGDKRDNRKRPLEGAKEPRLRPASDHLEEAEEDTHDSDNWLEGTRERPVTATVAGRSMETNGDR